MQFYQISGRYRRSWTKKEKEHEKWMTHMLGKFAISLEIGIFYIVPTIFLILCPGFYWNEIYLTSVPIQAFLRTYLGIEVSLWNLRSLLIVMHSNFVISTIFHMFILGTLMLWLSAEGYYVLYQKLV